MSVGLKLRLLLSVSSTYKAHSLALYCLPLLYPQITLTYSFLPKSSYFSTESTKFGAFKKIRKKKIFKLLVEILRLSLSKFIELEYKQIVPFSLSQSPLSTLHLCNFGNFSSDTSCDSVWPMKSSLHAPHWAMQGNRRGSAREKRNPSISWEIFGLLAVFISLAVMGWFHLLTKRFIMPSCDEIEAKMASTWQHVRCRIPEF